MGSTADADARVVIGERIHVYWPLEDAFFAGVVHATPDKDTAVRYDDGDFRWHDLSRAVWRREADREREAAALAPGARVAVYWPAEGRWFAGSIARQPADGLWLVRYDDGDVRVRRTRRALSRARAR